MSKPKNAKRRATYEEILAGKKSGRGHPQAKTHPWKSHWFKLEAQTVKHGKAKK